MKQHPAYISNLALLQRQITQNMRRIANVFWPDGRSTPRVFCSTRVKQRIICFVTRVFVECKHTFFQGRGSV